MFWKLGNRKHEKLANTTTLANETIIKKEGKDESGAREFLFYNWLSDVIPEKTITTDIKVTVVALQSIPAAPFNPGQLQDIRMPRQSLDISVP